MIVGGGRDRKDHDLKERSLREREREREEKRKKKRERKKCNLKSWRV